MSTQQLYDIIPSGPGGGIEWTSSIRVLDIEGETKQNTSLINNKINYSNRRTGKKTDYLQFMNSTNNTLGP